MPWNEVSRVSLRKEFASLALQEDVNMSQLCERYQISRKTGYKWRDRYAKTGIAGLVDRPKKPKCSPNRTPDEVEQAIISVRREHPAWGGRKISKILENRGFNPVPAASTVTGILHRFGLIDPSKSAQHKAFKRFEHETPNKLWQMDFKGHFACANGRCHPLTVLDDHSRFCMALAACDNERGDTVKAQLTEVFNRYGLPERMTMDNGSPWGSDQKHTLTPFTVWLIRLGIKVSHSRPYHPQTQGKDERFHRTLKLEVLKDQYFKDVQACQESFDDWRETYNLVRPHDALNLEVPASRYKPSPNAMPQPLPKVEYAPGSLVRKVQAKGLFSYKGHVFKAPKALRGFPVALRHTEEDGVLDVIFCQTKVAQIDLTAVTKD